MRCLIIFILAALVESCSGGSKFRSTPAKTPKPSTPSTPPIATQTQTAPQASSANASGTTPSTSTAQGTPSGRTETPTKQTETGAPITEEKSIVAAIPGIAVQRVGVNFEDIRRDDSDGDFNDIVLCFEGGFKVDGSNVVSLKEQTITIRTHNNAGCQHDVQVDVKHSDGSSETPITFESGVDRSFAMKFKVASRLETTVTNAGNCSSDALKYDMHSIQAKVLPDVCND